MEIETGIQPNYIYEGMFAALVDIVVIVALVIGGINYLFNSTKKVDVAWTDEVIQSIKKMHRIQGAAK